MLNLTIAKQVLGSKIKSRQVTDQCTPRLAPDLVDVSGEHIKVIQDLNGVEGVIEPEIVFQSVGEFHRDLSSNIPDWDNSAGYTKGQKVKYNDGVNSFIYVCRQSYDAPVTPPSPNVPSWDSAFWETNLSAFFRRNIELGASSEVDLFFTRVQQEQGIKRLMNAEPLHEANTKFEQIKFQLDENDQKKQNFRGYRFKLESIKNIQIQLTNIGIYCDTIQRLPFYLYHSSQNEPIQELFVNITSDDINKFRWKRFENAQAEELSDVVMNYIDDGYNVGGYFYLGFYENDLLGNMFGFRANSVYDGYVWNSEYPSKWSDYYGWCKDYRSWFTEVLSQLINDSKTQNKPNFFTFDRELSPYNYNEEIAFNLKLNAECDYTYFIQQTPNNFTDIAAYYAAEKIIRTQANSIRLGKYPEFLKDRIPIILYGIKSEGGETLQYSITETRVKIEKALELSLNELDDVCFERDYVLRRVY